jgi:hypothetical protein
MNNEIKHIALCPEIDNYAYLYADMKNTVLKNRAKISLHYYIWNAYFYKVMYYTLSIISIILPSLATVLTCIPDGNLNGCEKCLIAAITAITAINSGLLALLKCNEKKKSYRDSAENLKKELSEYRSKTGNYKDADEKQADDMLSGKIEEIISKNYSKILDLESSNQSSQ